MRLFAAICLLVFSAFTAQADVVSFYGSPTNVRLSSLTLTNGGTTFTLTPTFSTSFGITDFSLSPDRTEIPFWYMLSAPGGITVNLSRPATVVHVEGGLFNFTATLTLQAYSGLDGTGTLLGTAIHDVNEHIAAYHLWTHGYVSFGSTAGIQSFRVVGVPYYTYISVSPAPVPEPASLILLGSGLVSIFFITHRSPRCVHCKSKKWNKNMWPSRWICAQCGRDLKLTGKF